MNDSLQSTNICWTLSNDLEIQQCSRQRRPVISRSLRVRGADTPYRSKWTRALQIVTAVNTHKFHQGGVLAFSYKENVVCNLALRAFFVQPISTEARSTGGKDASKLLNCNDPVLQNETGSSITKCFSLACNLLIRGLRWHVMELHRLLTDRLTDSSATNLCSVIGSIKTHSSGHLNKKLCCFYLLPRLEIEGRRLSEIIRCRPVTPKCRKHWELLTTKSLPTALKSLCKKNSLFKTR